MLTIIKTNGSKWPFEKNDPIEKLVERLNEYTLNPEFEDFGNFIYPVENGKLTKFFGNFYDYSHVFEIETNDGNLIKKLTELIRKNQSTNKYLLAKSKQIEKNREQQERYKNVQNIQT